MPKGDNHPPRHLTREQRQDLRDQFAMRALPFCLMQAQALTLHEMAERATATAYLIADAMLSQRGLDDGI